MLLYLVFVLWYLLYLVKVDDDLQVQLNDDDDNANDDSNDD